MTTNTASITAMIGKLPCPHPDSCPTLMSSYLAAGEDPDVIAVVGLHHLLALLQLFLALLPEVGLRHVLHQALDDTRLAGLDVLQGRGSVGEV